jgi:hypothetical protein
VVTVNARRRWAERMIRAAGKPIPRYGSPEWLALPDGDRRKVAGVVVAAENWALDGDELEKRLRREVELLAAAYKRHDDEDYEARREAHRAEWSGLPSQVVRIDRARAARSQILEGGEAS